MDYLDYNHKVYEKEYESGWGNKYADTKWITIFYRCISPLLK